MISMKKDFKIWHERKTVIDGVLRRPFFHDREIWFCHLGTNIGFEQDGAGNDFLRPVVIVRKFNNEIFWGVPLTRSIKKSSFYFQFSFEHGDSSAILSQIRLIDARRLGHKIGMITKVDFEEIKKRLKALLP